MCKFELSLIEQDLASIFDASMANHTIDIYYFAMSPPSRATLLLVKALGLKHNVKIVNILNKEQMNADFIKMNPVHTVPTIDDNGFFLWDSHVIMKYLVDQYAKDDSLCPKDAKRGAIVNQRLHFESSYLFSRLTDYAFPVIMAGDVNKEKFEKCQESLEILNGFLQNQSWVAGPNMTIADFSMIGTLSTYDAMGVFDLTKYENIWAWYERAKNAMAGYGYNEVIQAGADIFGGAFKSKVQ